MGQGVTRAGGVVLVTLLVMTPPAPADESSPPRDAYLRYCSACHGPEGKGDGLAATFLTPKPTDLTRIAARNGGTYPHNEVLQKINGAVEIPAHGDATMPVWGERFEQEAFTPAGKQTEARGKVLLIIDHLESIQAK